MPRNSAIYKYFLLIASIRDAKNDLAKGLNNMPYYGFSTQSLLEKTTDTYRTSRQLLIDLKARHKSNQSLKPTISELKDALIENWLIDNAKESILDKTDHLTAFGRALRNRAYKQGLLYRYKLGSGFVWSDKPVLRYKGLEG